MYGESAVAMTTSPAGRKIDANGCARRSDPCRVHQTVDIAPRYVARGPSDPGRKRTVSAIRLRLPADVPQ